MIGCRRFSLFQIPPEASNFKICRDGLERFSVVCTVLWGEAFVAISQRSVWEIAGVVRGAVTREQLDGFPTKHAQVGESHPLRPNAVEARSSGSRDVLQLCNTLSDRTSIVVHVYGGDIGQMSRRSGRPAEALTRGPWATSMPKTLRPTISFQFRTKSGIEAAQVHRRRHVLRRDTIWRERQSWTLKRSRGRAASAFGR